MFASAQLTEILRRPEVSRAVRTWVLYQKRAQI